MQAKLPLAVGVLVDAAGWVKGIEARRNFKKRKDPIRSVEGILACDVVGRLLKGLKLQDVVLMIQRRWRGVLTRRRLLGDTAVKLNVTAPQSFL